MIPDSRRSSPRRSTAALLLSVIIAVHLLAALAAFSPWRSFFSAARLDAFDYCMIAEQMNVGRQTFLASGRLWGYDPFLLAGNVLPFIWNSNVILQLLAAIFSWLPLAVVHKFAVVAAAAAVPWLFYIACRGFGFQRGPSLVGALAGVAWFRLSDAMVMWTIGMTTGVLVYPLSLAGLGLLSALLRGERRGRWLLVIAPLALLVHKTAALTLALPAAAMVLWSIRRLDRRKVLLLGGAAALAVLVNSFWLVVLWRYRSYVAIDPATCYWVNHDPWAWWKDLVSPCAAMGRFQRPNWWGDMILRDLLLLGSLLALRSWRRFRWYGYGWAVLVIALLAYGGTFVSGLDRVDPSRYVSFLYALLAPPAVFTLRGLGRRAAVLPAALVIVLTVGLGLAPSSGRFFVQNPILAEPSPQLDAMAEWINQLHSRGRVHVEAFSSFERERETVPWNEQYGRVSIMLPTLTRTPLLGGHYANIFTKYKAANFFNGIWLGRRLRDWTEAELRAALGRYNVSYVLTWSQDAKAALSRFPTLLAPVSAPPPFAGWRVLAPDSWFLEGSGRLIRIAYDRLDLADVAAPGGRAVLSYHWTPTLRATGAKLLPVLQPGDPVPFIGLEQPARDVVITNGSAW
jgi:hypothetical protein